MSNSFDNVLDFYQFVDDGLINRGWLDLSYKVGVFGSNKFSLNYAGYYITKCFPHPPLRKGEHIENEIGTFTTQAIRLNANIFANTKAYFRQGDIVYNGDEFYIIISHTCVIQKDKRLITICPLLKTEDFESSPPTKPNGSVINRDSLNFIKENKNSRYISLPSFYSNRFGDLTFLCDLAGIRSINLDDYKILVSLTFPGLIYFNARISMFFHRDVIDKDDDRVILEDDLEI